MAYKIIQAGRQVDLTDYLGTNNLRKKIGFATAAMPEDLHYEESYEFIIPQDGSVRVKIFPHYTTNDKSQFDEVVVNVGEMLIIYPEYCHLVIEKSNFIALKVEGKYKILAKPANDPKGRCLNTKCSIWSDCEKLGIENKL